MQVDVLKQASLQSRVSFAAGVPAGLAAARYAKALAVARGDSEAALAYAAAQNWRSTPSVVAGLKAAVEIVSSDDFLAGTLPRPLGDDFLAAVRPATLVDRIPGFHTVPLNVSLLSIAGTATATFVGPASPKPVGRFTLERVNVLPFKVTALAVITIELLRSASPTAEVALGRELTRALSAATDQAFIDLHAGPVADTSPGSVTFEATTLDSTGSSLAQVSADLSSMIAVFASNRDEALARAVWIMSPVTALYLAQLRGSGGAGAYPNINAKGGELLGIPVYISGASYASGSPGESTIILLDPAQILLGDPGEVAVQIATHASLQLLDDPSTGAQQQVSLWQRDLAGILVERWVGWQRGSDSAVVVLENVVY